jgi:hypothetical protein
MGQSEVTPAEVVRAGLAGIAVRRRDLFLVAYLWTMSNGSVARRLGRAGWLLLPVSGAAQLLGAATVRRRLVRQPGVVIAVRVVGEPERPDLGALVLATVAGLALWLPVLAAPLLLPAAWAPYVLLGMVALAALMAADLAAGPFRDLLQRLWHGGLRGWGRAPEPGAVFLAALAAYPRGGGRGIALMARLNEVFDAAGTPSELELRTDSLTSLYERLGYRTIRYRRMRREPAGPATGAPVAARQVPGSS